MTGGRLRPLSAGAVVVFSATLAGCASDQRPSLQPVPSTPSTTTAPSPEEVKSGIRAGLASIRSFRAEIVVRHHGQERRKTLQMKSDGRVQETDLDPGRERTRVDDPARGISYGEFPGSLVEGLPPGRGGGMGPGPWTYELLPGIIDDPVLFARHVLDWPQFTVATATANERPAWDLQWSPPRGSNPDHVSLVVDRQTGLGVRAEAFFENEAIYLFEITALEVNGDLSILPPPAATGGRGADGYRRTTLEEAARLAGYQPMVPAWLPAGFTPAEVAHATQYRSSTAFLHPDSTDIVSAVYRRGLDEVVVTTRRRGSRPWASQLISEPPPPEASPAARTGAVDAEPAAVSAGAFAGARAERTTRAWYGRSHFWALNDQLSLLVQGDVTVEEMQRIVESLKPL